jgi:hypothetical protein
MDFATSTPGDHAAAAEETPVMTAKGMNTFSAEFVNLHRTVQAEMVSPEERLSDLLNGPDPIVDIGSGHAAVAESPAVDLLGPAGQILKDHILFVVPLNEPPHSSGPENELWKPTVPHRCWLGVGPYSLVGTLYLEPAAEAHTALRSLDKHFLPVMDVAAMGPDGTARDYSTVLVNRLQADAIALLT